MPENGNTDLNNLHQADSEASAETATAEEEVDKEWQESTKPELGDDALASLKAKYDDLEDQYKRLWADQQNMMNRFNREKQEIVKYAASNTLETILPALDNFDFAKKSISPEMAHDDIVKSIDMLQQQLFMCLKAVGLEEIDTNCIFNPEFHEAVSNIPDPEKPEGSIAEVLKKGFKVKDKVLRVATVVVTTKE